MKIIIMIALLCGSVNLEAYPGEPCPDGQVRIRDDYGNNGRCVNSGDQQPMFKRSRNNDRTGQICKTDWDCGDQRCRLLYQGATIGKCQ